MFMKRMIVSTLTAVVMAGAGLTATAGNASAAPANATRLLCAMVWHDDTTVGVKCIGGSFFAAVRCDNGEFPKGEVAASGAISYASCAPFNASLEQPIKWSGHAA
ncbi:hypothetical protein CP973_21505 [Streptomyces albofaciens JCM 4342]|nr:hypothetical protein CP973_21505 [Streptomyces albofaciens JCM 4342]